MDDNVDGRTRVHDNVCGWVERRVGLWSGAQECDGGRWVGERVGKQTRGSICIQVDWLVGVWRRGELEGEWVGACMGGFVVSVYGADRILQHKYSA